MLTNIITKINGNKTYAVAVLAAAAAVAQAFGYTIPEYVWTLLGAAGLGSVRHAVTKCS